PERKQRYTKEQRRGFGYASGPASWGASYESQGLRPEKEKGMAFLNKQKAKVRGGPFNPLSWQQQGWGSNLMLRAFPGQGGRINEGGGEWRPASEVLSPDHWAAYLRTTEGGKGQARQAFFDAHPELADRPGGGMDAWQYQKRLNNMKTDPVTGWKINRHGELYNPDAMSIYTPGYTGGSIGPDEWAQRFGGAQGFGSTMRDPVTTGLNPVPDMSADTGWEQDFDRFFGNGVYRTPGAAANQYTGWRPFWLP
ncbi:MAG: hypothetical protein L0Y56_01770, partial [Nitrospira sp.]|nr:hypothetical protein [Nitrospira sp.]